MQGCPLPLALEEMQGQLWKQLLFDSQDPLAFLFSTLCFSKWSITLYYIKLKRYSDTNSRFIKQKSAVQNIFQGITLSPPVCQNVQILQEQVVLYLEIQPRIDRLGLHLTFFLGLDFFQVFLMFFQDWKKVTLVLALQLPQLPDNLATPL